MLLLSNYVNYSIICIIFYSKLPCNLTFLTFVESVHLWYFWIQIVHRKQRNPKPLIFDHQQCWFLIPKPSDYWNTYHYRGWNNHGEEYLESVINCLASGNLRSYTTVPVQFEWFPCTWTWRLLYFDCSFYCHYCYSELSILFLFIFLRDTSAYVHWRLFSIDLLILCYFYFVLFLFTAKPCFSHKFRIY